MSKNNCVKKNNKKTLAKTLFARMLNAHYSENDLSLLENTTVLVAGLGGGSNIAELLARKGVGRFILADFDRYEPHNIRQRGSCAHTWGVLKTTAMRQRLKDINPGLVVKCLHHGLTIRNIKQAIAQADIVVDMLDLSAVEMRESLHQHAAFFKKYVVSAPSVVNGAVLIVYPPEGPHLSDLIQLDNFLDKKDYIKKFIHLMMQRFPEEAPVSLYEDAVDGKRTVPLDAVGVDQAAVLAVAAIESIVLKRIHRLITLPRLLYVDVSQPNCAVSVHTIHTALNTTLNMQAKLGLDKR